MKQPKVTVLTVVYQGEAVIEDTLKSVTSQTYPHLEYIVVDGASRDATTSIIEKYRGKISKFVSERDSGIYDGMNKAVTYATGDYVLFMNAGDWFVDEQSLERAMAAVNDKVGEADWPDLIYGDCYVRYEDFEIYDKAVDVDQLYHKMICSHQSLLARRQLLLQFPFDLSYRICADFNFLCSVYAQGATFLRLDMPVSRIEAGGFSDTRIFKNYREKERSVFEVTNDKKWRFVYGKKILILAIKRSVKSLLPAPVRKFFLRQKYSQFGKFETINPKRLKLLFYFFDPQIKTGGHRRYVELFTQLAQKGHEISLISNSRFDLMMPGIRSLQLDLPSKGKTPFAMLYKNTLKRNRERIAEFAKDCSLLISFGETDCFAAGYLKKLLGIPLITGIRSNFVESINLEYDGKNGHLGFAWLRFAKQYQEALIAKNSDCVVFQNKYDRDSFSKRTKSAGKMALIPNNINTSWMNVDLKMSNQSKSLKKAVFLGVLEARKGLALLLKVWARLIEKCPDLQLEIFGAGPEREVLEGDIARLNLGSNVTMLGHTSEPLHILSRADLLLLPSLYDSYPNVVLESLWVGTPVLATRTGGVPELLPEEALFSPGDENCLYEKILLLTKSDLEYNDFAQKCRDNLERFEFDWAGEFEKVALTVLMR